MVRLVLQKTLLPAWDRAPLLFGANFIAAFTAFCLLLIVSLVASAGPLVSLVASGLAIWCVVFTSIMLGHCVENHLAGETEWRDWRQEIPTCVAAASILSIAAGFLAFSVWSLIDPGRGIGSPVLGAALVFRLWVGLVGLQFGLYFAAASISHHLKPQDAVLLSLRLCFQSPLRALVSLGLFGLFGLSMAILLPGFVGAWLFAAQMTGARLAKDAGLDLDAERKRLSGLSLKHFLQPWLR